MIKRPQILAAAAAALFAAPGNAALEQGAHVPSLVTQGALDGRAFPFNLQQALREGPVVLYFFPKANTPGCNLEAKAFAEKIDEFKRAGAQVIGMSGDTLEDLSGWMPVASGLAELRITPDRTPEGAAMRLDFDFKGGGGFVVAGR